MKAEELSRAFSGIDPVYLQDAEELRENLKSGRKGFSVLYPVLACAVIVLLGVFFFGNVREEEPVIATVEPVSSLPVLTVTFETEGMGFEGYDLSDVSEWKQNDVVLKSYDKLPVYQKNLPDENAEEVLKDTADQLGIAYDDSMINMEFVPCLETEELNIYAYDSHDVLVQFNESIGAETLIERYPALYGNIKNPVSVEAGEGEWIVYDGTVYSYFFESLVYNSDSIRFEADVTYVTVGDYPLITVEEAKDQLLNNAFEYGAYAIEGNEEMTEGEIAYVNCSGYEIPFYRFLVKKELMPDKYSWFAYYIPAVDSEYIVFE